MTDPIATLRAYLEGPMVGTLEAALQFNEACAAVVELERRAKIEARLDEWLAADTARDVRFRRLANGAYSVRLVSHWEGFPPSSTGGGPDYHTALEAALNAAGAP